MKNLKRLALSIMLVVSIANVNAQDDNNPWQITVGVNAVDVYPVGEDSPQGELFNEFYNVEGHWNFVPSLSSISVSKYLTDNFSFGVSGSFNIIEKWGSDNVTNETVSIEELKYYALDATVKYSLRDLANFGNFEPFLGLGGGYTWIEEGPYNSNNTGSSASALVGAGTVNGTAGVSYWFSDNIGLTYQATYKHSFQDYLTKHFQHNVGLSINFGGTDTDGDGVYDKKRRLS